MSKEVWRRAICPKCGRQYVERVWEEQTHVSAPCGHGNGVIDRSQVLPPPGKDAAQEAAE